MYVCASYACMVPLRGHKRVQSYKWLQATKWVLGTEPRTPERADSNG